MVIFYSYVKLPEGTKIMEFSEQELGLLPVIVFFAEDVDVHQQNKTEFKYTWIIEMDVSMVLRYYQPLSTIINHCQPLSTIINHILYDIIIYQPYYPY